MKKRAPKAKRFTGRVFWWSLGLGPGDEGRVAAVFDSDRLSLDLNHDGSVWHCSMVPTGEIYKGTFKTPDGKVAKAWGYLKKERATERVFIGEWEEEGEDYVFKVELEKLEA